MSDGGEEMQGHHRKILVINSWWAGIFASLFVALISAGFAFAWNANAAISVLQDNVQTITGSKLDSRLARIEEQQQWIIRLLTKGR